MRLLFFSFLILISCSIKNTSTAKKVSSILKKDNIELHFKLSKNKIKSYKYSMQADEDFYATLTQTNKSDNVLMVPKVLIYGHKGDGEEDHVEAFRLKGEEIDIRNSADYSWIISFDEEFNTELKPNESKLDTVSITSFYNFKEKGDFKLRFVYASSENTLYSNWDTLKVY